MTPTYLRRRVPHRINLSTAGDQVLEVLCNTLGYSKHQVLDQLLRCQHPDTLVGAIQERNAKDQGLPR